MEIISGAQGEKKKKQAKCQGLGHHLNSHCSTIKKTEEPSVNTIKKLQV